MVEWLILPFTALLKWCHSDLSDTYVYVGGKKRGFKLFWMWHGCWRQLGYFWAFLKLPIFWDFPTQPCPRFPVNVPKKKKKQQTVPCLKCLVDDRGQTRMTRLLWADRKATVTLITTCYNHRYRQHLWTHHTLKQRGYRSSRRAHRLPLVPVKKQKLRLQITQTHQRRYFKPVFRLVINYLVFTYNITGGLIF